VTQNSLLSAGRTRQNRAF